MSWSITPPRKPPFFRRTWFLVLFGTLTLVALVAAFFLKQEWDVWDEKAKSFDYTKLREMESASIIFDRQGQVLGRIFIQNRDEVALSDLSPQMLKAVIGAEDARFYQHDGVDYFGILRAAVRNYQAGRTRQGASTLTQQLARNTFPDELPSSDRSYQRKLLEMAVAREIERRFEKSEILSLYLNRVFFGSGFYGVEAASRGYFGKHAKELNLSEAATLAGLLKSPNNLSPWKNHQKCIESRNLVLQRLLELKLISKQEHDATRAQDLIVKRRRPIHQESYAAELVTEQVKRQVGDESAFSEGYRIYTTIDASLQKKLETSLRDQLTAVEQHEGFNHQTYAKFDQIIRAYRRKYAAQGEDAGAQPVPEYLQGSGVVLENATGGILALVGGRDVNHSPYNRALYAKRPVGTAFKPLVYAAAFENGLFPGTAVQDSVIDNRQVMIGGTTGILGEWGPERIDNRYEGLISARTALVKSKNAATVRMGMMIGKNLNDSLDRLASLSKTAGIDSAVRPYPASFLGSSEMTLLEMTLANTSFPGLGTRPVKPFIIERIEDKDGKIIFQEKPARQKVMRSTTAYEVHNCLAEVLDRGTADRTFSNLALKRADLGGKTGTAYNFTDVWFLGYSSEVTCGIWAGFDKPRTTIYRGAFSNEIALPVWVNVMRETFAKYKPQDITPPQGLIKVEICASSGLLATDKCFETTEIKDTGEKRQRRTTYMEICTEAQAPKDGCDVHGDVPRSFVKDDPRSDSQWPRAQAAATPTANTPVVLKSATVVGNDPYNSIQAVNNVMAMKALEGGQAPLDNSSQVPEKAGDTPQEPEVRRAEPVSPLEQQPPAIESPIKLEAPKPIEF